jgi:hypothetical protein
MKTATLKKTTSPAKVRMTLATFSNGSTQIFKSHKEARENLTAIGVTVTN